MTVASATAMALRDEVATALARECPECRKLIVREDPPGILMTTADSSIVRRERVNAEAGVPSVWYVDPGGPDVSLIERQLDPVPHNSSRPWGTWLKVAGCELC